MFDSYAVHLPSITADAGMFEQVIMNLVVNARDAMPKGGRITISTNVAVMDEGDISLNVNRQQGCFVSLVVSDTGGGMSELRRSAQALDCERPAESYCQFLTQSSCCADL